MPAPDRVFDLKYAKLSRSETALKQKLLTNIFRNLDRGDYTELDKIISFFQENPEVKEILRDLRLEIINRINFKLIHTESIEKRISYLKRLDELE